MFTLKTCLCLLVAINAVNSVFLPFKKLDEYFCRQKINMRTAYQNFDGFSYSYYDSYTSSFRSVDFQHQIIEDEIYQTDMDSNFEFATAGLVIPKFNFGLIIGVKPMQINGAMLNPDDVFELEYGMNVLGRLITFGGDMYGYRYESACYINGCISDSENLHRAYYFNFCHDTKFNDFYSFTDPCYLFFGENTTFDISAEECRDRVDPYLKPNFCKLENLTKKVFNTLFPYNFTMRSKGGLFRTLLYYENDDILIWVENNPFSFQYLANITDPFGNYSNKWIDISEQIPRFLVKNYYFAGGFVFPRFKTTNGSKDGFPYLMFLPKNFTSETEAFFRKVKKFVPFELENEELTLDQVINADCSRIVIESANILKNYQYLSILMMILVFGFMIMITLMTKPKKGINGSRMISHSQSVLIKELQNDY